MVSAAITQSRREWLEGQEVFRTELKRAREARRWSQERLAHEARMDHSLVSRLESGQRAATHEAVVKLAAVLYPADPAGLHDRALLLLRAGFLADHNEAILRYVAGDVYGDLYAVLADERMGTRARAFMLASIGGIITHARAFMEGQYADTTDRREQPHAAPMVRAESARNRPA